MKLVRKTKIVKPQEVYNLHVAKNHNYIANNTVVSNCHGLTGRVLTEILNTYGSHIQFRFGLTGTLPKAETDALSVHIALGETVYEIPAHQLIDEGFLAKMHVDIFQLEEDFQLQYDEYLKHTTDLKKLTYKQFKDSVFPEWTDEKRYLETNKTRQEWITNFIEVKRDAKKGNVLCLVTSIAFGKKLAKLVDNAVFVYGKDKQTVRKEIYSLFNEHDNLVVIASIKIASTGLNIKRIFNLMFIDVGKSFIRIIQSIGRGLRKAPDKDYVSVSDICTDLKYGKRHLRERVSYYKESKYPHKKHVVKYTK